MYVTKSDITFQSACFFTYIDHVLPKTKICVYIYKQIKTHVWWVISTDYNLSSKKKNFSTQDRKNRTLTATEKS